MSLRERTRPGLGIIEPCLPSPAKAAPSGPGWLHEIKHDGFLGNWNMGLGKMTDSGSLSWEAQEVFQKIKSFNRLPGGGIPLIQLNMRVGSAKTVKKGIPELKSAGLITNTVSGEPTFTDKGYKTLV